MSAIAIASCSLPSTSSAIAARIQAMSAPAQNEGPSPASTTARRADGSSRARAMNVERNSAIRDASKALWTSGRASVTRATTPPGPVRSSRRAGFTAGIVPAAIRGERVNLWCREAPIGTASRSGGTFRPWVPRTRGLRTGGPTRRGIELAAIRTARRGALLAAVLLWWRRRDRRRSLAPEAAGRPWRSPVAIALMAMPGARVAWGRAGAHGCRVAG